MNSLKYVSASLVLAASARAQLAVSPISPANPVTLLASPFGIGLAVGDIQKEGILVPVQNTTAAAIQVLGVQTTGDLFIESAPTSIAANSSANLTVIYYSSGGTSGGTDTIRVLTSSGIISIPVNHGRPQVVTMSGTTLSWAIGESGAKSVTVTVVGGATVPMAAHAFGTGNTATITPGLNGTYSISVLPGSLSTASHFPVIVDLDPALPDVLVAIDCTVGLASGN